MPRHIEGAVEGEAFRAVVLTEWTGRDGIERVQTSHYGPYSKASTAKSTVTRETKRLPVGWRASGYVERSTITWERLT